MEDEVVKRDIIISDLSARMSMLETRLGAVSVASVSAREHRDLVVVGDSIVRPVDVESIKPGGTNDLICLPGARVFKVHCEIKKAALAFNVKNLVVHAGSNNIPDCQPHQVANQIIQMLRDVRLDMPTTNIYFSALIPKSSNRLTNAINHVNYRVFLACQEFGITYIDHPFIMVRGVMSTAMYKPVEVRENRPVHLSSTGAAKFGLDIARMLK